LRVAGRFNHGGMVHRLYLRCRAPAFRRITGAESLSP
jgi:hypothetical protein